MSTQPSTPHPDPYVPWLDLSMGVPDWLAEYELREPGWTMRTLYDNALPGTSIIVMNPKDITMILEELIRYREAYHAARRGEVTRLTQVLDANDDVKNALRQERDYAVTESASRIREIAELRKERDHLRNEVAVLLRTAAAMEAEMTPQLVAEVSEKAIFVPGSTGWIEGYFVEEELVKYVGTLRSQLDELRPRVHNLEAANTALHRERDTDAEKIASLEALVIQLGRGEPLIKPTASERVQLLEIDLASAYQTIEELKDQRDKAARASGEFMHERDMAQRRADTLKQTVDRQSESIEHMMRKVQELTDSLTERTAERDQAWTENVTLVERTSEMCSRADGLVIRANSLEAEAERLNTRIVELETTMQQGAIKLRGVVDRVQARQARSAPIEPWGLVRDPEEDEDDGRPVVEPFTTSREDSKVKLIEPVWPSSLSPEAIRNFQATVRRGPGTRTYSIHGSDEETHESPRRYEHVVTGWLGEDEFRAKLRDMEGRGYKLVSHQMDLQDANHYCVFGRKA